MKPRVFYISYDGVGEPLGRSQVLAYLTRLAQSYEITLFSYEKPGTDRRALAHELRGYGIDWVPLSYHRKPPVLSTAFDVGAGVLAVATRARRGRPEIVHARSDVPALVALLARRWTGARLLFDIRGFWADERVEGGIWPASRAPYRALYRLAKRAERWFYAEADGIVTLTHASVPHIRAWLGGRDVPVEVIPTCVDLERFSDSTRREHGPHLMWCGSLGTWYRFDLVPSLAEATGFPIEVVTRDVQQAERSLGDVSATVRTLAPSEVPGAMRRGDIGLCLCVGSFSKTASAPTRFAEHLAAGMPVIVTRGMGDLEAIVSEHRVGVVLAGEGRQEVEAASQELAELVSDPDLSDRCRAVARELFDVAVGSTRYARLYAALLGS